MHTCLTLRVEVIVFKDTNNDKIIQDEVYMSGNWYVRITVPHSHVTPTFEKRRVVPRKTRGANIAEFTGKIRYY